MRYRVTRDLGRADAGMDAWTVVIDHDLFTYLIGRYPTHAEAIDIAHFRAAIDADEAAREAEDRARTDLAEAARWYRP